VKLWPFGTRNKSSPEARACGYLAEIRLAGESLGFPPDLVWHRECSVRPEALAYISSLVLMMETLPSSQSASMPFSAGLIAGIRLAAEPAGDEGAVQEGFRVAVRDFPRPELDPDRHKKMSASYGDALNETETAIQSDRMRLLAMECKRDPRAEDYLYQRARIDSLSEFTIGAFQAGMIAGARLVALGYAQPMAS
jgi:hypothetical protein